MQFVEEVFFFLSPSFQLADDHYNKLDNQNCV